MKKKLVKVPAKAAKAGPWRSHGTLGHWDPHDPQIHGLPYSTCWEPDLTPGKPGLSMKQSVGGWTQVIRDWVYHQLGRVDVPLSLRRLAAASIIYMTKMHIMFCQIIMNMFPLSCYAAQLGRDPEAVKVPKSTAGSSAVEEACRFASRHSFKRICLWLENHKPTAVVYFKRK